MALLLVCGAASLGCHRQFYRRQADQEAYSLIGEKSCDVARPPESLPAIYAERRSRMFNPFNLDFQPMPLDDPASYKYMQCVDGRRGYPMWEAAGLTNTAQSPDWWQFLPLNDDGVLVLNAENSVQLALLHSPEYQEQVEQLYLSALDVSSERFRFDTQFFGGAETSLTAEGPRRRGAGGESSTRLQAGTFSRGRRPLSLERTFATGGELIVGVANNIVWELSGPNRQSASTVLDFALLQPLLRGAGRDRVMERLTLAERRLLANVRSFERFRRAFYLNIVTGRNIDAQVQRSGGVFGVGLGGFTGLGGGFAGLGGRGGGFGNGGGAGVPQAGGFFGLLQDQLQIRNLEENIARLSENLLILENTLVEMLTTIPDDPEAILRQRLQIAQQRSALLNAQTQLVSRRAGFQSSVDTFLGELGLPPYICVKIEDPVLEQFELIDRELRSRREELVEVRTNVGQINVSLLESATFGTDPATGLPQSSITWSPEVAELVGELREEIRPLAEFNATLIEEDLPRVAADIEQFLESLPERREQNADLRELYRTEQQNICSLLNISEIDESVFDIGELSNLGSELRTDFRALEERLRSYQERIETLDARLNRLVREGPGEATPEELGQRLRNEVILASQDLLSELGDDVLALQLIQARARTESVVLPEVDIAPEAAFQIARRNRRDWANARASLVDSWRLIEFNADDLESSLDLTFSGDIQNVGNNPLDLRGDTGRLRVGLQWDAPITRLQERNTYRQSLIEYEQSKRDYYNFQDGIWQLLRGQIRQLRSNRFNFELGRQSVRIAASQIELNEDIRSLRDARGLSSGPTAARDTISALEDLLNSQNALLNIFVNYEVIRRSLDLDLGTMQLTEDGLWLDPGAIEPDTLLARPGTTTGGMIHCDCHGPCHCGLPVRNLPLEPMYGSLDPEVLQTSGADHDLEMLRNDVHFEKVPSGQPSQDAPLPPPMPEPVPVPPALNEPTGTAPRDAV